MSRHVIFAVHGIHTGAENWTDAFRRWAMENDRDDISVEEYDFGKILGIQMYAEGIIPALGWMRQNAFAKWMERVISYYPDGTKYSIVAHSFGTWLTQGTLWRNRWMKPQAVVLFGSVLTSSFHETRFPELFKRHQIQRLMVFWSPKDFVVEKFCNPVFGISPFGHLGCRGFKDEEIKNHNIVQVKTNEEHSTYFTGRKSAEFFKMASDFCVNGGEYHEPERRTLRA